MRLLLKRFRNASYSVSAASEANSAEAAEAAALPDDVLMTIPVVVACESCFKKMLVDAVDDVMAGKELDSVAWAHRCSEFSAKYKGICHWVCPKKFRRSLTKQVDAVWINEDAVPADLEEPPTDTKAAAPAETVRHVCNVCNITCNSVAQYRAHVQGKSHRYLAKAAAGGNAPPPPPAAKVERGGKKKEKEKVAKEVRKDRKAAATPGAYSPAPAQPMMQMALPQGMMAVPAPRAEVHTPAPQHAVQRSRQPGPPGIYVDTESGPAGASAPAPPQFKPQPLHKCRAASDVSFWRSQAPAGGADEMYVAGRMARSFSGVAVVMARENTPPSDSERGSSVNTEAGDGVSQGLRVSLDGRMVHSEGESLSPKNSEAGDKHALLAAGCHDDPSDAAGAQQDADMSARRWSHPIHAPFSNAPVTGFDDSQSPRGLKARHSLLGSTEDVPHRMQRIVSAPNVSVQRHSQHELLDRQSSAMSGGVSSEAGSFSFSSGSKRSAVEPSPQPRMSRNVSVVSESSAAPAMVMMGHMSPAYHGSPHSNPHVMVPKSEADSSPMMTMVSMGSMGAASVLQRRFSSPYFSVANAPSSLAASPMATASHLSAPSPMGHNSLAPSASALGFRVATIQNLKHQEQHSAGDAAMHAYPQTSFGQLSEDTLKGRSNSFFRSSDTVPISPSTRPQQPGGPPPLELGKESSFGRRDSPTSPLMAIAKTATVCSVSSEDDEPPQLLAGEFSPSAAEGAALQSVESAGLDPVRRALSLSLTPEAAAQQRLARVVRGYNARSHLGLVHALLHQDVSQGTTPTSSAGDASTDSDGSDDEGEELIEQRLAALEASTAGLEYPTMKNSVLSLWGALAGIASDDKVFGSLECMKRLADVLIEAAVGYDGAEPSSEPTFAERVLSVCEVCCERSALFAGYLPPAVSKRGAAVETAAPQAAVRFVTLACRLQGRGLLPVGSSVVPKAMTRLCAAAELEERHLAAACDAVKLAGAQLKNRQKVVKLAALTARDRQWEDVLLALAHM